jgi:hypothetical protein
MSEILHAWLKVIQLIGGKGGSGDKVILPMGWQVSFQYIVLILISVYWAITPLI